VSELAALLRRLREQHRLTQEELAERAGVSARTISDVERGLRTRVYNDTAARLVAALDVDADTASEFLEVARGRAAADGAGIGALPQPLMPLVGREDELAEVVAELNPPTGRRLVTITGLGGSGKTRLALAAARELAQMYERVRFLPLASVAEPDLLHDALARLFQTVPSRIGAAIGDRPALVLLDAFEHVQAAAPLLAELLQDAAGLRALVTSRLPLRIPGERELRLGPLRSAPAGRLFLDRAHDLAPDLADDPATVAEICALTGGLPLAIELAAAHVRYLPLPLLRDRLRSGLADANHVVQDAVAWSVASLSGEELRVLTAAAVFAAGFGLDALQALCPGVDVVPALGALADKSLIVLERADGLARWRMLDVVRETVRGRQGAASPSRAAYTGYYLALLDELAPNVGNEEAWYRILAVEEPNIRTALVWAEAECNAETLLALATRMWLFWQARGGLAEGRRWLERGLAMTPPAAGPVRRTALWGLGWLAYHQGDDATAGRAGAELLQQAREAGDELARRNGLTVTGMVCIAQDRTDEAVRLLTEALDLARDLDHPWVLATSLLNVALGRLAAGSVAPARASLAEALRRYDALGDRRFHARCVGYLGLAALLDGDAAQGRGLFRQSLAAFRDLGEPAGIAEGLAGLAAVSAAAGELVAAATMAGAADRVRQRVAARELPLEQRVAARYLGAAAGQLGAETWDAAWRRGAALSAEQAIRLGLGLTEAPSAGKAT
jgi:predicted ATPase/DNA-binding XRE family transcriptional regulator